MKLEYTCEQCGKAFYAIKSANRKYCSKSCNTIVNNKTRQWKNESRNAIRKHCIENYQGENNPNYKGGGKKFTCLQCGRIFSVSDNELRSNKRTGKYCSYKCSVDSRHVAMISKGQRHTNKKFARQISTLIHSGSRSTKSTLFNLVDYSYEELLSHIENQFADGMTWTNYGLWHIDHIKPVSYYKFDEMGHEQFRECWRLNNLQPLWAKDNISKGGSNTKINQRIYGNKT